MDTPKSEQYAENILNAITQVVQARESQLQFDKTVIATIKDNSEKNIYKYIVATGYGSYFTAYSDGVAEYEVGDRVRITIPNGDYSGLKVIEGYAVDPEDSEQDAAERRYKQYKKAKNVDIINSNNIVFQEHDGENWVTSDAIEFIGINRNYMGFTVHGNGQDQKIIITVKCDDNIKNFNAHYDGIAGYTGCLFDLSYYIGSGKISDTANISYNIKYKGYDQNDRVLKEQDFTMYESSSITSNIGIKNNLENGLVASVHPNFDDNFTSISHKRVTNFILEFIITGQTSDITLYFNPMLSYGYAFTHIDNPTFPYLYTSDTYYYKNIIGSDTKITKPIFMRVLTVTEKTVKEENIEINGNCYFGGEGNSNNNSEIFGPNWYDIQNIGESAQDANPPVIWYLGSPVIDVGKAINDFKVQYNGIKSDSFSFASIELLNNSVGKVLDADYDDDTSGAYSFYGEDGRLLKPAEAFKIRTLRLDYLNTANWSESLGDTIVGFSTLFNPDNWNKVEGTEDYIIFGDGVNINSPIEELSQSIKIMVNNWSVLEEEQAQPKMLTIKQITLNPNVKDDFLKIKYQINNVFIPNESQVNIKVNLYTDNDSVSYNTDILFSTAGTWGSDYNLVLTLCDENKEPIPAILIGQTKDYYVKYELYDYTMKPLENDNDIEVLDSNIVINSGTQYFIKFLKDGNFIKVQYKNNINFDNFTSQIMRIEGTTTNEQKTTVIGYLPFAFATEPTYSADCVSTVVYDITGKKPVFYQGNCVLYDNNEAQSDDWDLRYNTTVNQLNTQGRSHQLSAQNRFLPLSIYSNPNGNTDEQFDYTLVVENKWYQSLAIIRNKYPAAMQNIENNQSYLNSTERVYSTAVGGININYDNDLMINKQTDLRNNYTTLRTWFNSNSIACKNKTMSRPLWNDIRNDIVNADSYNAWFTFTTLALPSFINTDYSINNEETLRSQLYKWEQYIEAIKLVEAWTIDWNESNYVIEKAKINNIRTLLNNYLDDANIAVSDGVFIGHIINGNEVSDLGLYGYDRGTKMFGLTDEGNLQIGYTEDAENQTGALSLNITAVASNKVLNNDEGILFYQKTLAEDGKTAVYEGEGDYGSFYSPIYINNGKLESTQILSSDNGNKIRVLPQYLTSLIVKNPSEADIKKCNNKLFIFTQETTVILPNLANESIDGNQVAEFEAVLWTNGIVITFQSNNANQLIYTADNVDGGNTSVKIDEPYSPAAFKFIPTLGWLAVGGVTANS